MAIGYLVNAQNTVNTQKLVEEIGENMPDSNLPYTVQAKLIYLIENLGIDETNANTTIQQQLQAIMDYLTPPTTCVASSVLLGTTQQIIIASEIAGSTRKSFSIFNESTTATVYLDFVTGVTSTKKKLQLPPLYFWEPSTVYQGDVFAISSEANTNIEVRIER